MPLMDLFGRLVQNRGEWRTAGRWFLLSGAVGIAAGLGGVAFFWASEELSLWLLGDLAGYHPRPPGGEATAGASQQTTFDDSWPFLLVLLPMIGGLISGWVVFRFAPEAEGHGTDAALLAYHQKKGRIAIRVPFVKTFASVVTLGTGGSGGREGPIAQIGAGIGSILATRLGLSARERRILLAAGMGAGVAAVFRAPLAGALFAAEIHYRDPEFESDVIIPATFASILSYCVYASVFGYSPLFTTSEGFGFDNGWELLPYTVLAIVVSMGGFLFVKSFYGSRNLFARIPINDAFKPAIGGALTGLIGLALYYVWRDAEVLSVMGFGYGALQNALDGRVAVAVLLVVAIGKILTTSATIGSGGSGGVFGPSMVIGGALGGAVGLVMQQVSPGLVTHPGTYVLVGMAGFFAGAAHTPISTVIMVCEMTGNYELLVPAMWVTTICSFLLYRIALYENQLPNIRHSPAHRGDFFHDVLAGMSVSDVTSVQGPLVVFSDSVSLGTILHEVDKTHQNYFPVVDEDGLMARIFSLNDVRPYFYDEASWRELRAADLGTDDIVSVTSDDSLSRAIRRMTERNVDAIPVVDAEERRRVLHFLRRKDLIDAYNRQVKDLADSDS